MLKIKNLNKYFNKHKPNEIHVINNTTLEFPDAGLIAILGESGSGKTTLMNVLGGLDSFDSGEIDFDNHEIKKYNALKIDKIRNQYVGYIFQNFLLLQNRTVKYNLALSLGMYGLTLDEENERIDYVLDAIGMLKYKNKLVSELSGGQRQRVAIARALIKAPKVILADEPTGNLDEKNTIQIMNIIKKISEKTLVILVSHERHIARSYADWIIEVVDGKVVKNEENKTNSLLHRLDDQALYLKEYPEKKVMIDNNEISIYSNEDTSLMLKIIYENGKFYVSSNQELTIVNEESEVVIKDELREDLDTKTEILKSDYELPLLEVKKSLVLPFKERIAIAKSNLVSNKKRRFFLSFALMIISILILICIESIIIARKIDVQSISVSDSRIYNVTFEKSDPLMSNESFEEVIKAFLEELNDKNKNIEYSLNSPYELTYTFKRFSQLEAVKYSFKQYSFMPIEYLKKDDLYLGRLPQNEHEIVIDAWVLENGMNGTTLSNVFEVGNFLNQEFYLKERDLKLKVVGISKSNENTIYVDKWLMFSIYPSNIIRTNNLVASVSMYNNYNGKSLITNLSTDEAIVNEDIASGKNALEKGIVTINDDANLTLKAKGGVKFNDFPYKIIVSDELYEKILYSIIAFNHGNLSIICNNRKNMNQLKADIDEIKESFEMNISHSSKYDELLEPYYAKSKKAISSRILIVATIFIVSFVIIFFSMRSYAIKNIYDLGVFRAIGISKGSIVQIYAIEILKISLRSTLISSALTFILTNVLKAIPIFLFSFAIPFNVALITCCLLIIINILIGILPIILYMRLTPSQLLSKYDI